ncbi:MAG: zf-TFIIB domain-containing protein [Anaerolineae bacterium]|nr:zf-TFIIB domain-containing protein [Anaerolineae bacterium]
MKCPLDGTELKISERQGIEIDYCPQCRGVWLDRGELDKIIERSAVQAVAPTQLNDRRDDDDDDYRREGQYEYEKPKRRKSFLDDLFDF